MVHVIYILPHHDDEVFVLPKIREDLLKKRSFKIIHLTTSTKRQAESHKFFSKIGVPKDFIVSLPKEFYVNENKVVTELPNLLKSIKELLNPFGKDFEFVSTGFEGGHQDHDAASILTRALAKYFNSPLFEFFLYNNINLPGKMYRVGFLKKRPQSICKIRYTFSDLKNLLYAPLAFRSQAKAMLGLLPLLFLRALIKPLELRLISPSDHIPWPGEIPMYERWGRMTYKDFIFHVERSALLNSQELPQSGHNFSDSKA